MSKDMTIEEFGSRHYACNSWRTWAIDNCETMHDVWHTAWPDRLVWVATRPGVLDDNALRLFACWCVRQVWPMLMDERSKIAVEVAERHARGDATDGELSAARYAARDAARYAARYAARAASKNVALGAARDAAWAAGAASSAVARYAASYASRDVACAARAASSAVASDAARDVALGAARTAQAEYLREHCTPSFAQGGREE